MRLYFDAIEQKYGKQAGSATLLWPRQGQRVPADLSRPAVRATLASFSRAWDYMNSVADAATFPAVPSALCGWCPAVNSCPVAMVKTDNAKASAATQHGGANGPVALGIPTVREFVAPPRMDKTDGTVPAGQENTVTQTAPGANLLPFPNNKWAVMSVASLTDAAAAHLDIYGQVLSPPTINALANTLGGIVVDVHKAVFMGGFDWSFDSASRVVYSLNASLRSRPAPFGQDEAAWEKWRGTLVGLTAAKLRIAIPMVDVTEFGAADFGVLIAKTTVPPKAEVEAAAEPEPALV
jgi:putative RecB family exonuclease